MIHMPEGNLVTDIDLMITPSREARIGCEAVTQSVISVFVNPHIVIHAWTGVLVLMQLSGGEIEVVVLTMLNDEDLTLYSMG